MKKYWNILPYNDTLAIMKTDKAQVIVSNNLNPQPEPHEVEVARIIARYYNCSIEFIQPLGGYKIKTADFIMNSQMWEIKSPQGNSKEHTIKDQFQKAKGKNHFMIIDGRRSPLEDELITKKIYFELTKHKGVKKLLFIAKSEKVIEIK